MGLRGRNSKNNVPEDGSQGDQQPSEVSPMATYNNFLDEMKKSFAEQNQFIKSLKLELEERCDKNSAELSAQLKAENSNAIAQIEQQTKITLDNLSTEINDLKGEPLKALNFILNSTEAQDLIKDQIAKVMGSSLEEMKKKDETILQLRKRIDSLEKKSLPASKANTETSSRLDIESALRKRILTSTDCDFARQKFSEFIISMSKEIRSPMPLFRFISKRKALLTFDSFSAARSFQACFIQAHKNNKIDIVDSPASNRKLRLSDYIPPSLASSKFSMLALGRYLKDNKIIDQYNINLIQSGLKLSVLGRKDSQPEGPSVWLTTIKDYPVVADIKDLALGAVPITYEKVDKDALKKYVDDKEKEKRDAKKSEKSCKQQ